MAKRSLIFELNRVSTSLGILLNVTALMVEFTKEVINSGVLHCGPGQPPCAKPPSGEVDLGFTSLAARVIQSLERLLLLAIS